MPLWDTASELTASALDSMSVEQGAMALWHEFLGGYFSGSIHTVEGVEIDFPLAAIKCQETQFASAGAADLHLAIHVLWLKSGAVRRFLEPDDYFGMRGAYQDATWTFHFRAKGQNQGDGGPRYLVRRLADLAFGLLQKQAVVVYLGRKGIRRIRPQSPVLVSDDRMHLRSMIVKARLVYDAEANSG